MVEIFQKYMGTGLILILFAAAVIYLLLYEKRKPVRILLVYVPILVLLIFFNPLFYRFFSFMVEDEIYFRLGWLLPVTVVLAYTVIVIYQKMQGKKQLVFALVAAIVLIVSGKLVYSSQLYSRAENPYHVPQKVVDICDAIELEGREVMAAFPGEFLLYVRQYSPFVCMPYGREVIMGQYNELYTLMMSDEIDVERLATLAKQYLCHYIILPEDKLLLGDMEEYSYEVFANMHGYVIYRDTTMNFSLVYEESE
ncbi:MAG: hypothetical protein E7291_03490 [Lachnospiraceae bacterium]|nr:hypothetical protein [Lachnospiraceae bacterium]